MSDQTRAHLIKTLCDHFRVACRCEAIAVTRGLYVKAEQARLLQTQLVLEINALEWEAAL